MYYPSAVIRKPDSALSSTSEYSVQNKVVKAALDLKADAADLANYYLKTETYNKTEVDNKVDSALTSAYKAGGSCTFANLPALSAANEGYVYDVSDAFTTTSDFVEGAGKSYPAGTNVAIIDVGSEGSPVYKYDVMAGFIDQTLLQTKALSTPVESQSTVEGALAALSTNKLAASDYVVDAALDATSENPVQNKVVKGALDLKLNASAYVVDNALSDQSENPVQNKVVKAAIDQATGKVTDKILTQTLAAGNTTVTFTDTDLTSTAIISIFTDKKDVHPTAADDSTAGSLTLTFDEQESALTVKVVIKAVPSV